MLKLKKSIQSKTLEFIKPILKLIVKEISVSNDDIKVIINLNAYIDNDYKKDLEVIILEETENVRNVNNQLKQKMI